MRFTNDPICVAICREFVETALRAYPRAMVDRAVLVTSELVTNVILHTPGGGLLELGLATELLQVVVSDQSEDPPVELPHGESAFHGRGLPIVRSLADDWGVDHTDSGKSVWATFVATAEGRGMGQVVEGTDPQLSMYAPNLVREVRRSEPDGAPGQM